MTCGNKPSKVPKLPATGRVGRKCPPTRFRRWGSISREHSMNQIALRLFSGGRTVISNLRHSFGYFNYIALYISLLFISGMIYWRKSTRFPLKIPVPVVIYPGIFRPVFPALRLVRADHLRCAAHPLSAYSLAFYHFGGFASIAGKFNDKAERKIYQPARLDQPADYRGNDIYNLRYFCIAYRCNVRRSLSRMHSYPLAIAWIIGTGVNTRMNRSTPATASSRRGGSSAVIWSSGSA